MLLGVRTASELTLLENATIKEFSPLLPQARCYGSSDGLGQYLVEQMFDGSTMRVARNVAVYILQQAKKYDRDFGVGGDSQVLLIPADRNIEPSLVPKAVVSELENQYTNMGHKALMMLAKSPGVVGVDLNTETKGRRDETMDTAMSAASTTYVSIEPAFLGIQGTVSLVKIDGPRRDEDDGPTGPVQAPPSEPKD